MRRAERMVSRWSGERQAAADRSQLVGHVRERHEGPRRVQVLTRHILEPQRQARHGYCNKIMKYKIIQYSIV